MQIYAQSEARKFVQILVLIETMYGTRKIDQKEAMLHMNIQKNATRKAFLNIAGVEIFSVGQAINAALSAVKDPVNAALGFTLL